MGGGGFLFVLRLVSCLVLRVVQCAAAFCLYSSTPVVWKIGHIGQTFQTKVWFVKTMLLVLQPRPQARMAAAQPTKHHNNEKTAVWIFEKGWLQYATNISHVWPPQMPNSQLLRHKKALLRLFMLCQCIVHVNGSQKNWKMTAWAAALCVNSATCIAVFLHVTVLY